MDIVLSNTGEVRRSRATLPRALAISEKQAGLNHPETARYLSNLAGIYRAQRKYLEADPYLAAFITLCTFGQLTNLLCFGEGHLPFFDQRQAMAHLRLYNRLPGRRIR